MSLRAIDNTRVSLLPTRVKLKRSNPVATTKLTPFPFDS